MNKQLMIEKIASRYCNILLISILSIGLLIRLYGINFGLPYLYDPDEDVFSNAAIRIVSKGDLNPHWFGAPASTLIYLLAILYWLIFLIGKGFGYFNSVDDLKALYYQDPTVFYLAGRLLCAVIAIATLIVVYLIGAKIFNRIVGLVATLLIAIIPLHVNFSKLIRMDCLMTLLILLAFWYCLKVLEENTISNYVKASAFTGLAIVTKYPAIVFILTIILTFILSKGWRSNGEKKVGYCILASVVAAFLGSPYLFLNFQAVLEDVAYENRTSHLSANGEGLFSNLIWYFQNGITDSFTSYGLVIIGIGFLLCLFSKQKDRLLLISFPVFFLLFISSLNLRWDRWLIPILPFGTILFGYGIYEVAKWIEKRLSFRVGSVIILLSLMIIWTPLFDTSLVRAREMSGIDTRTQAAEWMMNNLPSGSLVLVEAYTPQLPEELFKFYEVRVADEQGKLYLIKPESRERNTHEPHGHIGDLSNINEIDHQNIDYVVMSNIYQRYQQERARYPKQVAIYEQIMNSEKLIFEIERTPKVNSGPTIRIYKIAS